jgi:serine/threonine-protein kinase
MPYVQGESLRDRLNREKQLPIADAVRIATEVASALDYAHRHDVIHRDIKPENILLHDGRALVADFGIALAASRASGSRMTETGMSLGTPHYMSPEQAMGERTLDARTDIYALGCVTYEMLVGEPPFTGPTGQAIVAKVLTERPAPIISRRDRVPPHVDAATLVALEKLPADRFTSAQEFAESLLGQRPVTTHSAAAPILQGAAPTARLRRLLTSPLWVVGCLAALGLALLERRGSHQDGSGSTIRFTLELTPATTVSSLLANPLAISPDGQIIAFSGRTGDGPLQLFIRRMDDLTEHALPGTENGEQPFFSPDGRWLGFFADHQLKKVALAGGPPIPIADLPGFFFGACWGGDDRIVVSRGNRLAIVPAGGGAVSPLSPADTSIGKLFYYPRILPDGKTVIVTRWGGTVVTAGLWVATIGHGEPQDLHLPGTYPLGLIDGHLVYASLSGALMAVPFDLSRGQPSGPPVRAMDGVSIMAIGSAQAALSHSGSLVYERGAILNRMVLADPDGTAQAVIPERRSFLYPRYSPDGNRIAVSLESQGSVDVWVYDLRSRTLGRVTTEGTLNDRPEWTRDGSHLIFRSNRDGRLALWSQPTDGTGQAQLVLRDPQRDIWEGIPTPDGRSIIYRVGTLGTADIWIRPLTGDTTARPLVATPFTEWSARPSPDGRWLAYESNESGEFQVYVIPLMGTGGRHQISVDGGAEPVWAGDGTRLYYRNGEERMVARITTRPDFAVTSRDSLFGGGFGTWLGHAAYDVSPDGTHLLLLKEVDDSTRTIVVQNWERELQERLGKSGTHQDER